MTDLAPPPERSAADILRARARALAQVPEALTGAGRALDVVEFRLAQERYGFETQYVREVVPLRELTPLPGTPPFMLGIVNIRGQIVPVIDIKRFFDLPDSGLTDFHQVLVIEGHGLTFGVLADTTVAVRAVPEAALQPSLPTLAGIRAEYLKGVTADRVVILDAGLLASSPAIVVDQETET
jgi:purine-binding chemotaxis protein CheW